MMKRRKTREVKIGDLIVGGEHAISVQSMTTTKTHDITATLKEVERLEEAGCQIIRITVPDQPAADALYEIKKRMNVPLVADIHFNYRMVDNLSEDEFYTIMVKSALPKNRIEYVKILKYSTTFPTLKRVVDLVHFDTFYHAVLIYSRSFNEVVEFLSISPKTCVMHHRLTTLFPIVFVGIVGM